jgi:Galactosyltransferase
MLFSKPNVLLAVVCCHHRAAACQTIRETYLPGASIAYKFFFGRGSHPNPQEDEVTLDCDDAYRGLACKVWRIAQYAQKNGFDYVFKVDDDTYVRPERLNGAGYVGKEYVGMMLGATDKYHLNDYARGGTGYWLGTKALAALASAPLPNPDIPSEYAEDSWVGKTLKAAGIKGEDDSARLRCAEMSGPGRSPRPNGFQGWKKDVPVMGNNFLTCCEFLGFEMREVHNEWTKSLSKFNNLMNRITIK